MSPVVRAVALECGLDVDDLIGPSRAAEIVRARQKAMWLCHRAGKKKTTIGRFFNRDHTTVLHGIRRHEERLNAASAEMRTCYSASTCA